MSARSPRALLPTLGLLGLLALPPLTWALPETDLRSQTRGATDITAVPSTPTQPSTPQAVLTLAYTCPHQGRIHVLVTGRLNQAPLTHFESWFTQLSISRNSLSHGAARFYMAPPDANAPAEQDVTLQHFATCDAGQLVTYRLLANKGRDDQRHPLLLDPAMSLLFNSIGTP
jgi:hypothetical protein